jgi:predicted tellurium resistance membrane protein TerC
MNPYLFSVSALDQFGGLPLLFALLVFLLVAVDAAVLVRMSESLLRRAQFLSMGFWTLIAIGFGSLLGLSGGHELALQYFSGLVLEGMLSVDNLVLAVALLAGLGRSSQIGRNILMQGVWAALVIRGVFFFALSGTMQRHLWISGIVAGIMIVVGIRCLLTSVSASQGEMGEGGETAAASPFLVRLGLLAPVRRGWFSVVVLAVALELVNSVLSFDSFSALLSTSDNPFVLFSSSILGTVLLRVSVAPVSVLLEKHPGMRSVSAVIVALAGLKLLLPAFLPTPLFLLLVTLVIACGRPLFEALKALCFPAYPFARESSASRLD